MEPGQYTKEKTVKAGAQSSASKATLQSEITSIENPQPKTGWPAKVPLPVDPAWKADYAGSVKRLVLDELDLPLAHLFAQVATILPHEAEGIDRARSASERFLFQRLETLPQTKGLFRLNVELDIPFDGWGRMEVDLVCSTLKLAIEIDGSQHLSSVEAYRRDRQRRQGLRPRS